MSDAVDLFVGERKMVCNSDLEGAVFDLVFEGCREKTAEAVFMDFSLSPLPRYNREVS